MFEKSFWRLIGFAVCVAEISSLVKRATRASPRYTDFSVCHKVWSQYYPDLVAGMPGVRRLGVFGGVVIGFVFVCTCSVCGAV